MVTHSLSRVLYGPCGSKPTVVFLPVVGHCVVQPKPGWFLDSCRAVWGKDAAELKPDPACFNSLVVQSCPQQALPKIKLLSFHVVGHNIYHSQMALVPCRVVWCK